MDQLWQIIINGKNKIAYMFEKNINENEYII